MKALLALLAVVAAAAGLVTVGEATRPEDRPAAQEQRLPERVPVVAAEVVCPDVRQVEGELVTRVSAGAGATTGAAGTSGPAATAVLSPLASRGAPAPLPLTAPGSALTDLGLGVAADAVEVAATGALAPGLEVEALTRGASGASRGLAGQRCAAASVDQWFVGGGTRVGEVSVLVLANPDRGPALVDVTAFGETAEADDAPGRGLVVPARGRRLVALNELAPDLASLTVRVQARRGRVAAGVLTTRVDGRVAKGVEWAAAVQPPATRAVVPGLVQGSGPRRVLVANPTDAPTTVSLDVTTADGQDSPPALASLPVPARRVLAVDLTDLTATGPLAVTVRSSAGPVLAAGLLVDGEGPVTDLAYAASARPLDQPALLADLTLAPPVESVLSLSAVDGDATVRVTAVAVPGNTAEVGPPVTLEVPGGSTRSLLLSRFAAPGATARLAVRVEVLDGGTPVYAARFLQENAPNGPLTTSLDLRPASGLVDRPRVAADATAGRLTPEAGR